jgi:hypothetical protein
MAGPACFISFGAGVDIEPLRETLRELGASTTILEHSADVGRSAFESVAAAIWQANLVIGVLSGSSADANVWFELGYARGIGKLVMLIGGDPKSAPFDVRGLVHVPAGVENAEALRFTLEQVLAAPPGATGPQAPLTFPGGTLSSRPSGAAAPGATGPQGPLTFPGGTLSPRPPVAFTGARGAGAAFEQDIAQALSFAGVRTVSQTEGHDIGADFAVWMDQLEPITGNPILIEAKLNIPGREAAQEVASQVIRYLERSAARVVLVVFQTGAKAPDLNSYVRSPLVIFVDFDTFSSAAQSGRLPALITSLRNDIVHRGHG